jgi:HSP20 family protein
MLQCPDEEDDQMTGQGQRLPIRVYRSDEHWMLAAPMPGLEPDDISITVHGDRVVVHGQERGSGQHELDLLIAEWSIGPYHREVELPEPVDGTRANATYGNGVVVVSLPKAASARGAGAHFQLRPRSATRGERIGHRGKNAKPVR